jgi:hypothetical protein
MFYISLLKGQKQKLENKCAEAGVEVQDKPLCLD